MLTTVLQTFRGPGFFDTADFDDHSHSRRPKLDVLVQKANPVTDYLKQHIGAIG